MSKFIGKYEAKADAKGRIFIPSSYRKLLSDTDKARIVMRKDYENDCLVFYPESVWEVRLDDFKSKLNDWNPTDELLLMQFVADAEYLDVDSQGRVLLSKRNLQVIGVDNAEVLFVGMIDRFAVWNKARFEQACFNAHDFAGKLKERMVKPAAMQASDKLPE